jgi:hypothetical protein
LISSKARDRFAGLAFFLIAERYESVFSFLVIDKIRAKFLFVRRADNEAGRRAWHPFAA